MRLTHDQGATLDDLKPLLKAIFSNIQFSDDANVRKASKAILVAVLSSPIPEVPSLVAAGIVQACKGASLHGRTRLVLLEWALETAGSMSKRNTAAAMDKSAVALVKQSAKILQLLESSSKSLQVTGQRRFSQFLRKVFVLQSKESDAPASRFDPRSSICGASCRRQFEHPFGPLHPLGTLFEAIPLVAAPSLNALFSIINV